MPDVNRVDCVAPGTVSARLKPAIVGEKHVESFSEHTSFGYAAQPEEIALIATTGGETLPS